MSSYSFTPGSQGLVREALGHQIATAIARDILAGRLTAGELLAQEALCARFGTSRMPVRDALRDLASAGYLVSSPGNQLRVAAFEPEDVRDMLRVELTLAAMMAFRAAERATDAELAALGELHESMVAAAARGDGATMSDLNRQFHLGIFASGRSTRLLAAFQAVTLHIGWRFYVDYPERMDQANAEHGRLLDALIAHDAENAQQLMHAHVGDAQFSTVPMTGSVRRAEGAETGAEHPSQDLLAR